MAAVSQGTHSAVGFVTPGMFRKLANIGRQDIIDIILHGPRSPLQELKGGGLITFYRIQIYMFT